MITILANSTEFIYVQIVATLPESTQLSDPTSSVVSIAVPPLGTPPVTFYSASWLSSAFIPTIQFLVGPLGNVSLSPGDYDVYARITDSPQIPVLHCSHFRVIIAS